MRYHETASCRSVCYCQLLTDIGDVFSCGSFRKQSRVSQGSHSLLHAITTAIRVFLAPLSPLKKETWLPVMAVNVSARYRLLKLKIFIVLTKDSVLISLYLTKDLISSRCCFSEIFPWKLLICALRQLKRNLGFNEEFLFRGWTKRWCTADVCRALFSSCIFDLLLPLSHLFA